VSELDPGEISSVRHNFSIAELSSMSDNHAAGGVIEPLPDN
jgi:hypothetical protein